MLSQETANDEYCDALEDAMISFKDCCKYPRLKIPDETWELCEQRYPTKAEDPDGCLYYVCIMGRYAIITRDANGKITSTEPNLVGILNSYMSSVVNDSSLWEPVMKNVVTRCNDQFGGISSTSDCGIPDNFWDVIFCTYKQEMLQCPDWNYQRLPNCSYNYEWIAKCYS